MMSRARSGTIALGLSMPAAVILASLTVFGILGKCSPGNIAIFLVLLVLSASLAFSGIIVGAISYRRSKNAHALMSQFFAVVYVALLFYLVRLIG
jgi:hypothetical protein